MIVINKLSKRKAISPVIATVILVAVAITVAVAVSYWMSSIAGQYTSFEKVSIKSGYSTKIFDDTNLKWTITISLQNTGSAPSTITSCFINEKPIEEYLYGTPSVRSITWQYLDETASPPAPVTMSEDGLTMESGESATLYVTIEKIVADVPTDITFTSGTTINVKLHSAGGMDYIRLIQLT